jgi:hypothetical protein
MRSFMVLWSAGCAWTIDGSGLATGKIITAPQVEPHLGPLRDGPETERIGLPALFVFSSEGSPGRRPIFPGL